MPDLLHNYLDSNRTNDRIAWKYLPFLDSRTVPLHLDAEVQPERAG